MFVSNSESQLELKQLIFKWLLDSHLITEDNCSLIVSAAD